MDEPGERKKERRPATTPSREREISVDRLCRHYSPGPGRDSLRVDPVEIKRPVTRPNYPDATPFSDRPRIIFTRRFHAREKRSFSEQNLRLGVEVRAMRVVRGP